MTTVTQEQVRRSPQPERPLLVVDDLRVEYPVRGSKNPLRAVDRVSFSIQPGETFGLIGESGSGKSTVARAIMRLAPIAQGRVLFDGTPLHQLEGGALRIHRRRMAIIFQDSMESLDPRMTVRQSVAEPLTVTKRLSSAAIARRVTELLDQVGLDRQFLSRRPHQLSGGQKQRVNIARALAVKPELLICDEAVSALDVSIQAGILNLLMELQRELGVAYLFISHDLRVVAHMADRIGVMYLGRIVELGPGRAITSHPQHPYTSALLASEPQPLPSYARRSRGAPLRGDIPSPLQPPSGCRFRTRCPHAVEDCAAEVPALREVTEGRFAACHFAETLDLSP